MSDPARRIREATIDLMLAHGYEGTTIAAVRERAGVSREEFERLYEDKAHLYLAVWEEVVGGFEAAVYGAFAAHGSWRESLRACAYAAAHYIRDHPREVSFGIVEMFGAGEMAQTHRERQLQRMVDLVDLGRQELEDPDSVPRGAAEGVIGSIYNLLVKELRGGRSLGSVVDYVPEMMYLAVRPYLGHEVAQEELTMPPPREEAAVD